MEIKFIIKREDTNQGIKIRQFLHSKSTILEIKIITYQPRLAEEKKCCDNNPRLKRANYLNLSPSLIDGTTITRPLKQIEL